MRFKLPEKVTYTINTIMEAGFEAYAVGGCVRDMILSREPQDFDITTSARPEQIKQLFPRTIDTGIEHGTVTVMLKQEGFEITTYRIDGKYEDSRHPKEVVFTPSLREDLRRRDFTINAMAYNEKEGLIDIFGGIKDIEAGIIRCVGNPRERFCEDALRIMRAIRFSAVLGYEIEEETQKAICELAPRLKNISAERIQTELVRLIASPHPEYLKKAYETKVTSVILPEFDQAMNTEQNHIHHKYSVGEHILHSMTQVPMDKDLRLVMLFHDIGKPKTLQLDEQGITHFHHHAKESMEMAKNIMKRLRFDNETMSVVSRLVLFHDYGNNQDITETTVRRAIHHIGEDIFEKWLLVKRADILAQSDYMRNEKLEALEEYQRLYHSILEKKQCVSLKTLAVNGKDLMEAGMKPGPEIGETLEKLLDIVLDNPEENNKENLLKKL